MVTHFLLLLLHIFVCTYCECFHVCRLQKPCPCQVWALFLPHRNKLQRKDNQKKLTHLLFIDTYRFQAKWTQDFLCKHFLAKLILGSTESTNYHLFLPYFFYNTYSCCFVNFLVVRGLANFIIFTFSKAIWTNFCWNISLYR